MTAEEDKIEITREELNKVIRRINSKLRKHEDDFDCSGFKDAMDKIEDEIYNTEHFSNYMAVNGELQSILRECLEIEEEIDMFISWGE